MSIRKSLKEKSLQHFGSSEHKVLPRNKSFIEILLISGKIPAVDENKSSESVMKLNQIADVLVVKKT